MTNFKRISWILAFLLLQYWSECFCIAYPMLSGYVPSTVVDNKYRTAYHFQSPKNWINDPNGPMYYNGIYHLFYQYNPKSAVWGPPIWAHSVSKDMVNWKQVEPAIVPSKPFDFKGCWSGSTTMLPINKPVILYTGVNAKNEQLQNIAFPKNLSDPYLREWIKPDYNPIIYPPQEINASNFRDPTTAWIGPDRRWRLVIGSVRKHRGMAIMYRSKDFIHWSRAKHPLHSSKNTGMWECPDFYPIATTGKMGIDTSTYQKGVKYVMKASLDKTRFEYYTIGSYCHDLDKFIPDETSVDNSAGLRYDYGNFYASKTFFDESTKRRILMAWSNESDLQQDDLRKGWAGIQTIPRAIWLDPNGKQVIQWPIKEVETLRGKHVIVKDKKLKSEDIIKISGIITSQADVEVTFRLSNLAKAKKFDPTWIDPQELCEKTGAKVINGVGPFGLLTLASSRREEETVIFFRIFKAPTKFVTLMCQDSSRSSLRHDIYKPTYGSFVDVDIQKNGNLSLRTLIDHSVVESFGSYGKICITSRIYPTLALGEASHLFVFNNGAEDVIISELNAWEMKRPLMNGV